MPPDEETSTDVQAERKRAGALQIGSRKKPYVRMMAISQLTVDPFRGSCGTDPLVHHGRHFGHTVHALCTVSTLLNNGILRMGELADHAEETFTQEYAMISPCLFWFCDL